MLRLAATRVMFPLGSRQLPVKESTLRRTGGAGSSAGLEGVEPGVGVCEVLTVCV